MLLYRVVLCCIFVASRDYITSVVLGNDLVTRLSVSAMENLRSEVGERNHNVPPPLCISTSMCIYAKAYDNSMFTFI